MRYSDAHATLPAALRLPSLGGTCRPRRPFVSPFRRRRAPEGQGLSCGRFPLPASYGRGGGRASQVPGEPSRVRALLIDPGGTEGVRPLGNASVLPSAIPTASAPAICLFRGSFPRPGHSLSTLRSPDCSGTTQDSLPAAGLLCRAGLVTRWVPLKGFRFYFASSFPRLAWRTGILSLWAHRP